MRRFAIAVAALSMLASTTLVQAKPNDVYPRFSNAAPGGSLDVSGPMRIRTQGDRTIITTARGDVLSLMRVKLTVMSEGGIRVESSGGDTIVTSKSSRLTWTAEH